MAKSQSAFVAPDVEMEVEQALAICGVDPMAALRATLIANAFLEWRVEPLLAGQSAGYARGASRSRVQTGQNSP